MATHAHGRSRGEITGRRPGHVYSNRAILRVPSSTPSNSRGITTPKRVAVARRALAKAKWERRGLARYVFQREAKTFDTSPLRPSLYAADDRIRRVKGVLRKLGNPRS